MNEQERDTWSRVRQAIYATAINRASVELSWPACHKPRCNKHHPNPDEAFRIFADKVAETVYAELACKTITEPDLGDEVA